jgi:ABC-type Mn2+/Zn2+ transport system permease subunit
LGAAGYVIGLTLSALLDLPTGPVIVWSLAGLAVMMGITRSVLPANH